MERTKVTKEVVAEPIVAHEIVAIASGSIRGHLQLGKAHFEAGCYTEAIEEFAAILKVAPGNIETRVWLRKAKEALTGPETEATTEDEATPATEKTKLKECVWMKLGLVSYRICTNNYSCVACEFDQTMQDQMAKRQSPELDTTLPRFEELPGNQRLCRYALKGDVSYRLCARGYHCSTCEFDQMMEDEIQKKLAKLAIRREALRKRVTT